MVYFNGINISDVPLESLLISIHNWYNILDYQKIFSRAATNTRNFGETNI